MTWDAFSLRTGRCSKCFSVVSKTGGDCDVCLANEGMQDYEFLIRREEKEMEDEDRHGN